MCVFNNLICRFIIFCNLSWKTTQTNTFLLFHSPLFLFSSESQKSTSWKYFNYVGLHTLIKNIQKRESCRLWKCKKKSFFNILIFKFQKWTKKMSKNRISENRIWKKSFFVVTGQSQFFTQVVNFVSIRKKMQKN